MEFFEKILRKSRKLYGIFKKYFQKKSLKFQETFCKIFFLKSRIFIFKWQFFLQSILAASQV
jgi:hypothetical protein